MKGHILSRIQSYQSIRPKSISNLQEEQASINRFKMGNHDKTSKYLNLTKKPSIDLHHRSTLGVGTSCKKINTGTSLDPLRKSINRTRIEEIKRSIKYEREPALDSSSKKYFMISKKMSQKQFNIQEIRSLCPENQPNRQNTSVHENQQICSQRSLNRVKNIQSSKDLGETKITTKREFMKIFNRKNFSKEYLPSACTISQKQMTGIDKNQPCKSYDTLHYNDKKIGKMAQTTGIFMKEKNQSPYFQLTHKKIKDINQSPKHSEDVQEHASPVQAHQEDIDVSIEISTDNNIEQEKLNSISEDSQLSLSCSRIEQAEVENDSTFLGESQKEMLATMEQLQGRAIKKGGKAWRKLPNDFLKS